MKKRVIMGIVAATCLVSGAALAGPIPPKAVDVAIHKPVTLAQGVLDQNTAVGTVSGFNWIHRITFGGEANLDAIWSSTNPPGTFQKSSDNSNTTFNVNNANIYSDARINPWVSAHMNVAYYGSARPDAMLYGRNRLILDDVYARIWNPDRCPFFVQGGRFRVPFGEYKRHQIVNSLTQYLEETRATALMAGVVTNRGFYGKVYGFNGPTQTNSRANKNENDIENFGAQVGLFGNLHNVNLADVHYNLNVNWIRNMYDMGAVGFIFANNSSYQFNAMVDGLAAHGDLTAGPVDLSANYAGALGAKMNVGPVPYMNGKIPGVARARIWAADFNAGYAFKVWGRRSRLGLSYQMTRNMDKVFPPAGSVLNAGIPKDRYMGDYFVNVWKKTKVGVGVVHDVRYTGSKWTGKKDATQVIGRLSVAF